MFFTDFSRRCKLKQVPLYVTNEKFDDLQKASNLSELTMTAKTVLQNKKNHFVRVSIPAI